MIKAGPKSAASFTGELPSHLGAVDFAEATTGPLYAWQRDLLADLTATDRPRIAYVQVPRKNGKSRLAASVALDDMCRHDNRQVFLIADSERNLKSALFFELCSMVRQSPVLSKAVLIYKDHLECPKTGGGIYLRPNNLGASQSINPSLVLFDEVHMQKDDRIWNGMALAGAAMPHGLLLGITTPGYDVTSVAHGLYESVRAGHTWGRIYEPADSSAPLDDIAALRESNPVLVDRPDMFEVFQFERGVMPEHDYRRFRLGQWTTTAEAWLPYGLWASRATPSSLNLGDDIWLGFDGSYSGDSTALVACSAGGHLTILGCWENPGRGRGWRVPRAEVEATMNRVFADYNVVSLSADPPYWGRELAEWDERWPGRVVEFPTFSTARMGPACTAFYAAVADGGLTHDGDARLTRHVANCVAKQTPQGDVVTKASKDSPAKIDLAVASILAYQAFSTAQRQTRAVKVW